MLCERLAQALNEGTILELCAVFVALTTDVISDYCFGESYEYLLQRDFKKDWKETMETLAEGGVFRRTVPWLVRLMQRLPHASVLRLMPTMKLLIDLEKDISRKVEAIMSRTCSAEDKETVEEKDSIFKELRDNADLPPVEKSV